MNVHEKAKENTFIEWTEQDSIQGEQMNLQSQIKMEKSIYKKALLIIEAQKKKQKSPRDGLSNKYTDENYRYKDEGYIPRSKKELASLITKLHKNGEGVTARDINLDEIGNDALFFKENITLAKVFGKIDWQHLRDTGTEEGAIQFLNALYRLIVKNPIIKTTEQAYNYLQGIETIKALTLLSSEKQIRATLNEYITPQYLIDEKGDKSLNPMYVAFKALFPKYSLSSLFKATTRMLGNISKWDFETLFRDLNANITREKRTLKEKIELPIPTEIRRVGGSNLVIHSTKEMKDIFGLSAIQSGKWVLNDINSTNFHIENSARALMNLSRILGIEANEIGFGGRLGLAIGARGNGKALAHYERDTKVINITKLRGGGSLGHEYFHALDNIMRDIKNAEQEVQTAYLTQNKTRSNDKVIKAFQALTYAMENGDKYYFYDKMYTIDEYKKLALRANYNKEKIQQFGSTKEEVLIRVSGFRNAKEWYKVISAYFATPPGEGQVSIALTNEVSRSSEYLANARMADNGARNYWAAPHEMGARAFSAYLEDKMKEAGEYDNYLHGITDDKRLFPQGEERKAINKAFDELFAAIKSDNTIKRALANKELMDSIFGNRNTKTIDSINETTKTQGSDSMINYIRPVE